MNAELTALAWNPVHIALRGEREHPDPAHALEIYISGYKAGSVFKEVLLKMRNCLFLQFKSS